MTAESGLASADRGRLHLRLRLNESFRARESVSDLVQSVCCEILAHPERFEPRSLAEFRAWLCNAALMRLGTKRRHHTAQRRDRRRETRLDEDVRVSTIIASCAVGPTTAVMQAETQARIEQVFDGLPDRQREVLTLFRIAGMSHTEIAAQLRISAENSRTILNRAMAAFAARWHELEHR